MAEVVSRRKTGYKKNEELVTPKNAHKVSLKRVLASPPKVEESDDDDEIGSLKDFIEDCEEEEEEEEAEEDDETEEHTLPKEIDMSNIIYSGKRMRRKPSRYEDEVFASNEYRKMMLCDVPQEEMNAALVDEDFSDDMDDDEAEAEEDDDDYEEEEEEEEIENDASDEEDEATQKKRKKRKE